MTQSLKRKVTGNHSAISSFAKQFATTLETRLSKTIKKDEEWKVVARVVRFVRKELEVSLQAQASKMGALDAQSTSSIRLSVAELKPSEVIQQGKVEMSLATLYRAVDDSRYYCITPRGKTNGRLFPAWQFVDSVQESLPVVLQLLRHQPSRTIHAFWVTENPALNELSPAEVLAGIPFEKRASLHSSQQRLLDQNPIKRRQLVEAEVEHLGKRLTEQG